MKIAISNIGWTPSEEPEVAALLQRMGIRHVEIAPTKIWDSSPVVSDTQIEEYVAFWARHDIEIVAFQSMLFPRPDLKLFESSETRAAMLTELKDFVHLAGRMKAGVLVFGSPKNRQRNTVSLEEAHHIAEPFFAELGDAAQQAGTTFCIEPNAPQYACDFVSNAAEGIELVNAVNNAGFRLHLDIACMALAGDDVTTAIMQTQDILSHFHISSPMLEQVEEREDVPHAKAAAALRAIGYNKYVSIEMRPGEEGTNVARVRTAVELAQKYYA